MNNKGIKKVSIISVIIFIAIVLAACLAMKFAVKTVARMITGSVDYASSIVKVTPDEVDVANLIVVDKNGVRVGDTRVDFSGIQSENTAGVTVEGGSDGAIADVTESGFSQTRYTFAADINRSLDIRRHRLRHSYRRNRHRKHNQSTSSRATPTNTKCRPPTTPS